MSGRSAPILGYFEFYYQPDGQDVGFDQEFPMDESHFPRIRAMNTVNLLALALEQHGQTPTLWQRARYPGWAQSRIRVLPEGARLDVCHPEPEAAPRAASSSATSPSRPARSWSPMSAATWSRIAACTS